MKGMKISAVLSVLLAVSLLAGLAGCGEKAEENTLSKLNQVLPFSEGETEEAAVEEESSDDGGLKRADEANIGMIVRDVYREEVTKELLEVDEKTLTDVLFLKPEEDVTEFVGMYSSGIYGVQDVIILKPAEGKRETVVEALHQFADKRLAFFERYDVMNAYSMQKKAEVIVQGDYIIYLAVADLEAAEEAIDLYIPY